MYVTLDVINNTDYSVQTRFFCSQRSYRFIHVKPAEIYNVGTYVVDHGPKYSYIKRAGQCFPCSLGVKMRQCQATDGIVWTPEHIAAGSMS